FVMMSIGGLMVTAQAGPIAKVWGLSTAALTFAASVSPLANGGSRIFWGWASDRIGRERAMIVAFVLQAVSLLLVLGVGHPSAAGRSAAAGDELMADSRVNALAREMFDAYSAGAPIPIPPSARAGGCDLDTGYAVEAELVRLRRAGGHTVVGRKIGIAHRAA